MPETERRRSALESRGYRWGRCRGRRPESGRVVPELGARHVREPIFGAYRVFYRVGSAVEVLSVRHGSRPIRSCEVNGDRPNQRFNQVKSIDFRSRKVKHTGAAPESVPQEVLSLLDACIY